MPPLLTTTDLSIGYPRGRQAPHIIAEALNLTLHAGELVCLLGPNGAGKSTLIRTLAGAQSPLGGAVHLLGDPLERLSARELAQRVAVVLTERPSAGLLTGYGLVALGRHPHTDWTGALSPADEDAVRDAVRAVHAEGLAERKVAELSDGQRQKLMIARALAQAPNLLILDEPTAYLDLPRRAEIIRLLKEVAHTSGRAVLLSTHELDLALSMADRVWLMSEHLPLCEGAPEDLILNGAFSAAFVDETGQGVAFDLLTGTFTFPQTSRGEVQLQVTGEESAQTALYVAWTRRALQRAGYTVIQSGTPHKGLSITLHAKHTAPRWTLHRAGASPRVCGSLYALVEALG